MTPGDHLAAQPAFSPLAAMQGDPFYILEKCPNLKHRETAAESLPVPLSGPETPHTSVGSVISGQRDE